MPAQSILSSTSDGYLLSICMNRGNVQGRGPSGGNSNATEKLASAEHGLASFSIDALMSKDILCCCNSESLVYVRRP